MSGPEAVREPISRALGPDGKPIYAAESLRDVFKSAVGAAPGFETLTIQLNCDRRVESPASFNCRTTPRMVCSEDSGSM
jgi:hypothetical protein